MAVAQVLRRANFPARSGRRKQKHCGRKRSLAPRSTTGRRGGLYQKVSECGPTQWKPYRALSRGADPRSRSGTCRQCARSAWNKHKLAGYRWMPRSRAGGNRRDPTRPGSRSVPQPRVLRNASSPALPRAEERHWSDRGGGADSDRGLGLAEEVRLDLRRSRELGRSCGYPEFRRLHGGALGLGSSLTLVDDPCEESWIYSSGRRRAGTGRERPI